MKNALWGISVKSLLHYRRDAVYQFLITALLAAIIAGSLFTGHSVKQSLRDSVDEKLGATDILITTGLRYFSASLADTIESAVGENSVALLETEGYSQNFSTNATALDANIYGVTNDFFAFHGVDSIYVGQGTVIINERLAKLIDIGVGDEIMIRFKVTDPLPENAPFAPTEEESTIRKILRVDKILSPELLGNFSLGISQAEPSNIFMNLTDMGVGAEAIEAGNWRANRMLLTNSGEHGIDYYSEVLSEKLGPSDIGLTLRLSEKRGEPEIISDRIFIDNGIVEDITETLPTAIPIITYMANSFELDGLGTPYSFVAGLPSSLTGMEIDSNGIVINRWLADDIKAKVGDTLKLTWFSTEGGRDLSEKSSNFIVGGIIGNDDKLADPTLMPEFPGIVGSVSCSSWDAGVPILLDNIRDKDELYWDQYQGTPKAYINFETGKAIWSNNFGNATAIRFPVGTDISKISQSLVGAISPDIAGFSITNIKETNMSAANNGVDFSSLFLGLSFFIILSCVILLSMALTLWFNTKKRQVTTYHAIGYNRNSIKKLLLSETIIVAASASLLGSLMGYLVNILIVEALNSVWSGVVHTDTISPSFSIWPLLSGALATFTISIAVVWYRLKRFLDYIETGEKQRIVRLSPSKNAGYLLASAIAAALMVITAMIFDDYATILSFIAGTLVFAAFIFAFRQYYLNDKELRHNYSGLFFSRYPSQIVAPAIFLAAGIFAISITGANKLKTNDSMEMPSGGTGGYLFWAESTVPVAEDLNGTSGRVEFGLDESELNELFFTQIRRLSGDDASCLNINHVTSPAILGVPNGEFIERGSFSFASVINGYNGENPWELLKGESSGNTIYGVADQTVIDWSFKLKAGDTLKYVAENGQPLNIILCGGLKSSVFQGYLLIGEENFKKWFPSVAGGSVFLIDGDKEKSDLYRETFIDRFAWYGPAIEPAIDKLASFFSVTNSYLNVLMILGIFGMILGTAGLGFILVSNFNRRRQEFAIMGAFGFNRLQIRQLLVKDHVVMLIWGILTGVLSGITATLPSLRSGSEFPWLLLALMAISMFLIGYLTLRLSVKNLSNTNLTKELRRE